MRRYLEVSTVVKTFILANSVNRSLIMRKLNVIEIVSLSLSFVFENIYFNCSNTMDDLSTRHVSLFRYSFELLFLSSGYSIDQIPQWQTFK